MTGRHPPFLAWPGGALLRRALVLGLCVSAWWVVVFGGAEWIASLHAHRVRLHFGAELHYPYWPAAIVVYSSIYPLLWLAPFVLRSGRRLRAFTAALAGAIGLAGVCFLAFPGANAYPAAPANGIWDGWIRVTEFVNGSANYAPSLHVALAVVAAGAYAPHARRTVSAGLWLWAAAVAASTLLLHQHYLVDVLTGWGLGLVSVRWAMQAPGDAPALAEQARTARLALTPAAVSAGSEVR